MTQQFVIQSRVADDGSRVPLGNRDDLIASLAKFNTMPEKEGGDILWGPGICLEFPPNEDPVKQILVRIVEEEIAWLPLVRLAKHFEWSILDMETGRELEP